MEGTYRYTYDDYGNLTNKTLTGKYNQNASNHWFYEYADHGKTKTESHYHGPDNEVVEMKLRETHTRHYNDLLYLTEQTTETFDFSANINTSDWDAGLYIWEIWRDNLRKAAGKWVKRQ